MSCRATLFLASFLLATISPATWAQMFVIEFEPGENWLANKSYENQPAIKPHLEYWQQLYLSEVLLMSGPFADRRGGMMLISVENEATAKQLAADDPAVQAKLIEVEVRRWRLLSSAMRRSKPRVIELEADQSFRVESLDPGAPINLPGN